MIGSEAVRNHPNASLAATASAIAVAIITLVTETHLVSLTAPEGAVITGGFVSGMLVLGSRGLRGICMWVWRGDGLGEES